MKLAIVALAALLCVPAPASAALKWSPNQLRTTAIAAGLLATAAIIYNNERIHHRADNARNDAIIQELYERRRQMQQRQPMYDPEPAQPQVVQPGLYARYICVELDANGGCAVLRAAP